MNEIKLRIYDKEYEKMSFLDDEDYIYGYPNVFRMDLKNKIEEEYFWNDITDNCVIMQYIGLKDENGKEIYEGDVIKIDDDYELYGLYAGELYQVYYGYGAFRLKPKYQSENKGVCIDDAVGMTVVGNIYDNPELIK